LRIIELWILPNRFLNICKCNVGAVVYTYTFWSSMRRTVRVLISGKVWASDGVVFFFFQRNLEVLNSISITPHFSFSMPEDGARSLQCFALHPFSFCWVFMADSYRACGVRELYRFGTFVSLRSLQLSTRSPSED
jgi:hypothetical protein